MKGDPVYEEFYGLETKPFRMTPDPEFLFQSRDHREALAVLRYAVLDNQGFAVLVGEVGTGKTLLLHALLSSLPGEVEAAYLFCPRMDFRDLLRYLLAEFHVDAAGATSEGELLMRLNDYLTRRLAQGKRTLLVIDEAQNMDEGLLESIRMLSNLETSESKLLQIILAGQPELESKLSLPGMRQLRQRVSLKAVIDPLSRAETEEYIRFRMEVAGLEGEIPFNRPALDLIYEYSRGLPRTVNVVADNALLIGYAAGETEIGVNLVAEAIRDLERVSSAPVTAEAVSSSGRGFLLAAGALVTIAAAVILGGGFLRQERDLGGMDDRTGAVGAAVIGDPGFRADVPPEPAKEPAGTEELHAGTAGNVSEETEPEASAREKVTRGNGDSRPGDFEAIPPSDSPPQGPSMVPASEPAMPRVAKVPPSVIKPALSNARPLRTGIAARRTIPTARSAPPAGLTPDPVPGPAASHGGGNPGDESPTGEYEPPSAVDIPLIFAPPAWSPPAEKGSAP